MAHYLVAKLVIHDRDVYQTYSDRFMEVFAQYHGKMLAVDENPNILEGEWSVTRTVLIEFPTQEALNNWYESDAYQSIAKHRYAASTADVVILEGLS